MTDGTYSEQDFGDFQWIGPIRAPVLPRALLGACAVAVSASLGVLALHALPIGRPIDMVAAVRATPAPAARTAQDPPRELAQAPSVTMPAPARFAALRAPSYLSPGFTNGYAPVAFARSAALRSWFEPRKSVQVAVAETAAPIAPVSEAQSADTSDATPVAAEPIIVPPLPPEPALLREIPVPAPRPAFLRPVDGAPPAASHRPAPQVASFATPEAPAAPEQPSFFDRLFRPQQGPALAYAAPEDGGLLSAARAAPDRYTAVYNIASHTVTLPDGTRLEAHSGIGPNKDNPRSVAMHMRGATPPAVYDLTSREALFHGVAALRLNPVGDVPPFGRMGLLAHTYMLGPNGDSNGCVVFRDFASFRRAYDNGQIRRLVVVAGL